VDGALENLGILHLRDRAPYRLSGGEKRKVALASVLVLKPDVLLLDEPSAGLDPRSVGALIDILDGFHEIGGTIILATHDIPMLPEFADRALVLGEDHHLHADLPVADILADQPLLERYNLVHAHRHRHGRHVHSHSHSHG
jgi:cobalt/nickel transport system ATP-binding protein